MPGSKPDISDLTRILASETDSTRRKRKELLDKLEEFDDLSENDYEQVAYRLLEANRESERLERETYEVLDEYIDDLDQIGQVNIYDGLLNISISNVDISIFGESEDSSGSESSGEEESGGMGRRDFMNYAAGAGLTGLGLAGGAFAYDELTEEPQALDPEDYDLYISESNDIEELALEYDNSDTEQLHSVGDRLESESDNEDLRLGFKSTWDDEFIDINTGDDLVKRYELGQSAYERAVNEATDVTSQ